MDDPQFVVIREPVIRISGKEAFTPGKMYYKGVYLCETCEDEDRFLEKAGKEAKVYGITAIPRGKYRLKVTMSKRIGKLLPELFGVATHSGVRIHGANRAEDLLGCIGVGRVRTSTGIAQCADTVAKVSGLINSITTSGKEAWLEVK